jgi:hypothetical protein
MMSRNKCLVGVFVVAVTLAVISFGYWEKSRGGFVMTGNAIQVFMVRFTREKTVLYGGFELVERARELISEIRWLARLGMKISKPAQLRCGGSSGTYFFAMTFKGEHPEGTPPELEVELVDATGIVVPLELARKSVLNGKQAQIWYLAFAPTNAEYRLRVRLAQSQNAIGEMPVGKLEATPRIGSPNEVERSLWEESEGEIVVNDCPLADVLKIYQELSHAKLVFQPGLDLRKKISVKSNGVVDRHQGIRDIEKGMAEAGISARHLGEQLIAIGGPNINNAPGP